MTRRNRWTALAVAAMLVGAGIVVAQFPEFNGRNRSQSLVPNARYDGRFTFVRIRYQNAGRGFGRGGPSWSHDYNRAELHFGRILSEVSLVPTYLGGGNVLTLDDPELFKYPVAYIVEPGFWTPTDTEAAALRAWFTKGGFLFVDDFAGNQWPNLVAQFERVMPGLHLIQLDVTHPIFDSFFRIESLDFSHPYYGLKSEFWGLFEDNDPTKRLMAIVNYNSDIAEYWEWSDEDFAPIELTNEAYKLGVNYIVYALTH
jgi:hypothetical protein